MKKQDYLRPLDLRHGRVDMNHGAGGRAATQLVQDLFVPAFDNDALRQGNDAALLDLSDGQRLVMATDAHVVSPLFFMIKIQTRPKSLLPNLPRYIARCSTPNPMT